MFARFQRPFLVGGLVFLAACSAWAQTTTLEGDIKDENGQPLKDKGAVIVLDRTDIKGHYQVKSGKKGHWLYTGLPFGKYDVILQIDGKVADKVAGVQTKYGDSTPVDFDLQKTKQAQAATAQASQTGQLSQEQAKGMSKEQKDAFEAAAKKNSEAMKKNKALNDAFNAGQDALKAAAAEPDKTQKAPKFQIAIDSFNKAGEMDPSQVAVWESLGEAYNGLGDTQTGDDRNKSFDQAIAAYNKAIAIKPTEAAVFNQMGNIYGKEKKIPEATEALTKAAQLDPAMAGKAFFNMGANLVNGGQPDKAAEFFKKATDADPNYAEAWYQYGSLQMMAGKVDPKSGQQVYPAETAPALRKYLELQPSGPHAAEATAMLEAMGEKVQTNISVPGAKKKK
jgi:Tfp pilus assembly protein PilF